MNKKSFPVNFAGKMRSPFLGIHHHRYDVESKLLVRLAHAWLRNQILPFQDLKSILRRLRKNDMTEAEFKHALDTLENHNAKSEVNIAILKERVIKWNQTYPLVTKDWEYLYYHFPRLKEFLPRKLGVSPLSLYESLKEHVKGQDKASRQLCMYLYQYELFWTQRKLGKKAIKPTSTRLLIGETGSGKTYSLNIAAKLLDAGFIMVDCSRLVPEGIVGPRLYAELKKQYDKLPPAVKRSNRVIVFLDEFDKLITAGFNLRTSVLNELLILLDDKTKKIAVQNNYNALAKGGEKFNVGSFCYVLGGAFTGISKRGRPAVGFQGQKDEVEKEVSREQLIKFGVPKEIMGRIGGVINFAKLTSEDLMDILLNAKDSPLNYYKEFFAFHNQELSLTKSELQDIAERATSFKLGARGLNMVLSSYLFNRMEKLF